MVVVVLFVSAGMAVGSEHDVLGSMQSKVGDVWQAAPLRW